MTSVPATAKQATAAPAAQQSVNGTALLSAVIDCDIHDELPALNALFPYLTDHCCNDIRETGFGGLGTTDPAGFTLFPVPSCGFPAPRKSPGWST